MQTTKKQMRERSARLLAVLMALLLLVLAWGQTRTALAVPDELHVSQVLYGDDNEIDAQHAGQGFQTTKTGRITRISLWTYSAAVNNNVTLTVEVVEGIPGEGGASLGSAARSFAPMSMTGAWYDFTFTTPIPVTKDTPYHYIVTYTGSTGAIRLGYKITSPGNSPYPGGDSWTWDSLTKTWQPAWTDADFAFRVYLALNQAPTLTTNAGLAINEGATATIGSTNLQATDPDDDTITYTIGTAPVNGALKMGAGSLGAGSTFTQADIDAGQITYAHNGSETTADSFTFTAEDGKGGTIGDTTFNITVNPVNDPPTFTLGSDVTVLEESGAYSQANFLTGASAGEAGQTILSTTVTTNNNALFSAQPSIDGTGKLTFTPAANAHGTAKVSVTVQDNGGTANGGKNSTTKDFNITITPVNDPPSFTKGADQTVNEDAGAQTFANWATAISAGPNEPTQTVSFQVTNNNNALFTEAGQPAVDPTGKLTYIPAKDANGSATVSVIARDTGGTDNGGDNESDPQTFMITVNAVNDAPIPVLDTDFGTSEDSGEILILADLLGNDKPGPATATDEAGQSLEVVGAKNGTNGTVRFEGGNIYFAPAENFHGNATFIYTVRDGGGAEADGTVNVPITPVADTPSVTSKTINEDTEATGLVISRNAADGNEVTHFQITWTDPLPGTLKLNGGTPVTNGAYIDAAEGPKGLTFTPNEDVNGTFTFTVAAATSAAGAGLSDSVTFTVTINPVNDPPVAQNDNLDDPDAPDTWAEDSGPWIIPLTALTDNDFDGPATATDERAAKTLTVISVGGPGGEATGGTVWLDEVEGIVIFTPTEHYNGPAAFSYTVQDSGPAPNTATAIASFNITPVNDAPEGGDDPLTTPVNEDSGVRHIPIDVLLANDRPGPDGAPGEGRLDQDLSIVAVTAVTGATKVEISDDKTEVLFYLAPDFYGTAKFTYTLKDNGTPALTDEVTVTFPVDNIAEPPSANQAITMEGTQTPEDQKLIIQPDPADGASVTYYRISQITGGTLYKHDGITPIGDPDVISAAEGLAGLKFTPAPYKNGTTGFGFRVSALLDANGTGESQSTPVTIIVTEFNTSPTATGHDLGTTPEDTPLIVPIADLLADDSMGDPEESGQTLTFSIENSITVNGTVRVEGQNVVFTPTPDATGPASFTYTITDNGTTAAQPDPKSSTATVGFEITPMPEPPHVTASTILEDKISIIQVDPNESDGGTITHFLITGATGGTPLLAGNPVGPTDLIPIDQWAQFQAEADKNSTADGAGYFTITVAAHDSVRNLTSAGTTITIEVVPENDPPTANPDTAFDAPVEEDSLTLQIPVARLLANDLEGPSNEDDQILSLVSVAPVTNGGGTPSYDPLVDPDHVYFTLDPDFYGTAEFTYTVKDDGTTAGAADHRTSSVAATVTFFVTAVPDVPRITVTGSAEEDKLSGPILKVLPNVKDGAEITHFQVTSITGGRLFLPDGTTEVLVDGNEWVLAADAASGLRFKPLDNLNSLNSPGAFTVTLKAHAAALGRTGLAGTATITVTEVNDAPTGVADTWKDQAEDTGPWLIPIAELLDNDLSGPHEGDQERTLSLPESLLTKNPPVGGTVAISSDGMHVVFTPTTAHFNGDASFTYMLTDNGTTNGTAAPESNTATVSFKVTEVNNEPTGMDDALPDQAEDSGPWRIPFATLLANDLRGPENEGKQTLKVIAVGNAVGGKVAPVQPGDTEVVFTPTEHFNGAASFTYTLEDNGTTAGSADPLTAQATARFTVTPVNDAPVAEDKVLSVVVGNNLSGRLAVTDVEKDPLTYAVVDAPTLGTIILRADGSFVYQSRTIGVDTFTFKANDGAADSNVATVTVRAVEVPFVPVLTISVPVTETREESILVSGTANPNYYVAVGGTTVQADAQGNWSTTVTLVEGPNVITASHSDVTRSVTVVRDTTPPVLTLTASATRTEEETVVLTATTNEEGAKIAIEGQETSSLTVSLKMGHNQFTATATDRLGNSTSATVSVLRVGTVPPVLQEVEPGKPAEAKVLNFQINLPAETASEPLLLQILSPTADTAALHLAEGAAEIAGTGDGEVSTQANGTPLKKLTATVTFGYDPETVPNPEQLRIFYFDTKYNVWVEIGGEVNLQSNTITVQVSHFTTFAALVPQAAAPVLPELPAEVTTEKLTVTGTAPPGMPVSLVINGVSQVTVMTDKDGRYVMEGKLAEGRNWVYVKGTGALASREWTVNYRFYTDIGGYWAEDAINRLARLRIVTLYPSPLFQPEKSVTRLEFAVMVARVLGLTPLNEALAFTDTASIPEWARPEVAAAFKAGIIKGLPDGSFAPDNPVTRAEMAIMLARALSYAGKDIAPGGKRFADEAQIPDWAKDQVHIAARYGLITGYPNGSFGPSNSTTRAEAVTMLERLFHQVND